MLLESVDLFRIELVPLPEASQDKAVVLPLTDELDWPGELAPFEVPSLPAPVLTFPPPQNHHPPRVRRAFQNGSRLVFLFPGSVVALGEDRVEGYRLEPPVAGRWFWRSTSILMFEPENPLPAGTYRFFGPFQQLEVRVWI